MVSSWEMGLHNNDGNGRDTRLNVHNLSVKIVGGVRRQIFWLGGFKAFIKQCTYLQICSPMAVNLLGLWWRLEWKKMAETRDSTFIICQSKLSAVCSGNIFDWGVSRSNSKNLLANMDAYGRGWNNKLKIIPWDRNDIKRSIHNLSVKIVGSVWRQYFGLGDFKAFIEQHTYSQIWSPSAVNLLGLWWRLEWKNKWQRQETQRS